jgi:osmotically-inducible protein OsmY
MRTLLRAVLVLVLFAVAVVMLVGYWPADWSWQRARTDSPTSNVGTAGKIDTARAREVAADIGERAAIATKKVQETVEEAGLTAKIKAKMALDDTIAARSIDVSTDGSTVTVSGKVPSAAARDRAVALARETAGVTEVIDRLEVVPAS